MSFRLVLIFLSTFLLVSCSTKTVTLPDHGDINVVDIDGAPRNKTAPEIDSSVGVAGVGPESPVQSRSDLSNKNSNVWGLYLSPGLNRVICHAVAARALYEKGISFNVVTGNGMGAIVAAYLAQGTTPEIIEWKFHKFFKNSAGLKPFSADWVEQVNSDLLKDFKGKKIQGMSLTLIIPIYNSEDDKIEYLRRGDLHSRLLENLIFIKSKREKYSSTIDKGLISTNELRSLGIQKLVGINVLAGKVKFEKNEDFLFGVYGKVSGLLNDLEFKKGFD